MNNIELITEDVLIDLYEFIHLCSLEYKNRGIVL